MKKIVINLGDFTFEKLRLEAVMQEKSVSQVIEERIFHKSFSKEVLKEYDKWLTNTIEKLIKE